MSILHNAITDIPNILVGHAQDTTALTGCTVVICESGAVAGVDQRGGAPGTRETDALRPLHLVERAHAILLTGGSAFGLDAASGVMQYLEEKKIGFDTGVAFVPIVPAAVLFDLAIGQSDIRPNATMGYQACQNASNQPPAQGNVGAGCGATVGKLFGMKGAMKSGIGSASLEIGGGVRVAALIAVNAFGDVVNPTDGKILAGARPVQLGPFKIGDDRPFADTLQMMRTFTGRSILNFASAQNTVIGVVATNARLDKNQVNKVAQMAHNGLALTIRPAHTMLDGDTIFALATGQHKADVNVVGAFAAEVVARAIIAAIQSAQPVPGYPAASSYPDKG
jgi:L-aminopeptidase/D-esterase-like protein